MTPEERRLLISFVERLRAFLAEVLENERWFPPELAWRFQAAFRELESREVFDRIAAAIDSGDYDAALADHGLTGEQLGVKLSLFRLALVVHERARRSIFRRRARSAASARSVLEIGDEILESVLAAVPVPGAGAGTELKRAVEWALGFWKRWRPRWFRWRASWQGEPDGPAGEPSSE